MLRSIAIAAPAFNEAEGLEALVEGWRVALEARRLDRAEIVVCDDASTDATWEILQRAAKHSDVVRPVRHAKNAGAARAMATAIAATRADWVLMLDSDGQFPISCLDAFDAGFVEGADAYVGARSRKHDSTFARAGAWATTGGLNALYGTRYRDLSSACQLVRGSMLRALPLEARGLNYSVEVSARLLERGVRPVEVEIDHVARSGGRSTRTLVRSTVERAAFVGYFAARRALLRGGVIVVPGGT